MFDIPHIIRLQAMFGRTTSGRYLGQDQIDVCRDLNGRSDLTERVFERCINCSFVCCEEYYTTGCPNCGCKDTHQITSDAV